MDGNYLSDNKVYKKLHAWVLDAIASRPLNPFVSIDIDAWIETPLKPQVQLEYAVDIFLETVSLIKHKKLENIIQPMVALPLTFSEQLLLWKESPKITDDFTDTPPSIHLTEREAFKQLVLFEEYKIPIDLEIPFLNNRNVYSYYRCYRNLQEIQNNWEYARAIHFEYYPDNLILEKD